VGEQLRLAAGYGASASDPHWYATYLGPAAETVFDASFGPEQAVHIKVCWLPVSPAVPRCLPTWPLCIPCAWSQYFERARQARGGPARYYLGSNDRVYVHACVPAPQ
jgi:hypothetical protein